jgi:molybdopterin-guanine dinucleotide biosynthesis protein MobB
MDEVGKDTWKYARSGAKTVVAVSSNEITTIEKTPLEKLSLKEIVQRCRDCDLVFLEGFKSMVAKNKNIYKIVLAKSQEEIEQNARLFSPILAFTGPCKLISRYKGIPFVEVKTSAKLADLVEKIME